MAAPAPVDMDDCCPKGKCANGTLYSTCDPCGGVGRFDKANCDCDTSCPCGGIGSLVKVFVSGEANPSYTYTSVGDFRWLGVVEEYVDETTTYISISWEYTSCGSSVVYEDGYFCGTTQNPCSPDPSTYLYYTTECS